MEASPERLDYIRLICVQDWMELTGFNDSAELLRNPDYVASFRVMLRNRPYIVNVVADGRLPAFEMHDEQFPKVKGTIPMHKFNLNYIYDMIHNINQDWYVY